MMTEQERQTVNEAKKIAEKYGWPPSNSVDDDVARVTLLERQVDRLERWHLESADRDVQLTLRVEAVEEKIRPPVNRPGLRIDMSTGQEHPSSSPHVRKVYSSFFLCLNHGNVERSERIPEDTNCRWTHLFYELGNE